MFITKKDENMNSAYITTPSYVLQKHRVVISRSFNKSKSTKDLAAALLFVARSKQKGLKENG